MMSSILRWNIEGTFIEGSTAVLWHRDGAHVQMEKIVLLKSVNGIHLTKNALKPHDRNQLLQK